MKIEAPKLAKGINLEVVFQINSKKIMQKSIGEHLKKIRQDEENLRERYLQEPWGKFLNEIGKDPYNASIGERIVAERAAEKIEVLKDILREIRQEEHGPPSARDNLIHKGLKT